jgi:hypothetical protein
MKGGRKTEGKEDEKEGSGACSESGISETNMES